LTVYKDKRYSVEELTPQSEHFHFAELGFQFAIIDHKYCEEPFALLKNNNDGVLMGSIISHVDLGEHEFASFEHAVDYLAEAYDNYVRACVGDDVCDEAEEEAD